ncbi:MAG TPA: hypothetical protein VF072_14935 [Thermoleophilaceae bacterium]
MDRPDSDAPLEELVSEHAALRRSRFRSGTARPSTATASWAGCWRDS